MTLSTSRLPSLQPAQPDARAALVPDEILMNILSKLTPKAWLAARSVSRDWNRVAHDTAVRPRAAYDQDTKVKAPSALKHLAAGATVFGDSLPSSKALTAIGRYEGFAEVHVRRCYDNETKATVKTMQAQQRSNAHEKAVIQYRQLIATPGISVCCAAAMLLTSSSSLLYVGAAVAVCNIIVQAPLYAVIYARQNRCVAQEAAARRLAGHVSPVCLTRRQAKSERKIVDWSAFEDTVYARCPADASEVHKRQFHVNQARAACYEAYITACRAAFTDGWRDTYSPDPNMIGDTDA